MIEVVEKSWRKKGKIEKGKEKGRELKLDFQEREREVGRREKLEEEKEEKGIGGRQIEMERERERERDCREKDWINRELKLNFQERFG